jgi:hypothetical protein
VRGRDIVPDDEKKPPGVRMRRGIVCGVTVRPAAAAKMLETTETSAPVSRMSVPTVEPERKEMLDRAQVEEDSGEET